MLPEGGGRGRRESAHEARVWARVDSDMRLVWLVVAWQLREEEAHSALRGHGRTLLAETVVPVCVWRAGKVAAALRKASVSCLHRLLQFHLVSGEEVMACLGKGFEPGPLEPVLKSCLDDDDADVRFMTCTLLAELMRAVEGRLDDEQVRYEQRGPKPVCS